MREQIVHKEVTEREGRKAVGRHPNAPALLTGQAGKVGQDAESRVMPECTADLAPIMADDGTFYFMVGYSVVGGPDPVGP